MMAFLVELMAMLAVGVEAVALSYVAPSTPKAWLPTDLTVFEGFPPSRAEARKAFKVIGKVTNKLIKKLEATWARQATAAAHRVGSIDPDIVQLGDVQITTTHNSIKADATWILTRQNEEPQEISSGDTKKFGIGEFSTKLNHVYVITVGSHSMPFMVMRPKPDWCGVATYSATKKIDIDFFAKGGTNRDKYIEQACEPLELKTILTMGTSLAVFLDKKQNKVVNRGFGVEFEFVTMPPLMNGNVPIEAHLDFPPDYLIPCFKKMLAKKKDNGPNFKWTFVFDGSVHPFTEQQATKLELPESETKGWAFEIVSPGPEKGDDGKTKRGENVGVLSGHWGLQSVVEVLGAMKTMGVQAPPSAGLHVHVNVGTSAPPFDQPLTATQLGNIWVAYAKYQLVIDEFVPPMRFNNSYAQSLFLGNELPQKIFMNIFKHITDTIKNTNTSNEDIAAFCNAALGGTEERQPCNIDYPYERYYTLNLAALVRLGTLEFRSHSATYDEKQVLAWIMFHVAFVETFKGEKDLFKTLKKGAKDNADVALNNLKKEQLKATQNELESKIIKNIPPKAMQYLRDRNWANKGNIGCERG